jgi:hypothetical protein
MLLVKARYSSREEISRWYQRREKPVQFIPAELLNE